MNRVGILFVCMGNICRSPAAECVFRHYVEEAGLSDVIRIDSAGTIGYHTGDPPDHRMRHEGKARGIPISGHARQVSIRDLHEFDIILAMDKSNLQYLQELDPGTDHSHKLRLFCTYVTKFYHSEVPDPYYGGRDGFQLVMDLLEDGCRNLLNEIQSELEA